MRSLKSRGGLTRGKGFTPAVRLLWVHSMHSCSLIHNAMTTATNHGHLTSLQHVELGTTRQQRDLRDLEKVKEWLDENDPFDVQKPKLQSLSSNLIADENVNCDQIMAVGRRIQNSLDGMSVAEASIKRSVVKTLASLKNVVKIRDQRVNIDPTLLFMRLVVIAERNDNILSYFKHELTAVPTSLFVDTMMRKPNKASLMQSLLGKNSQNVQEENITVTQHHVVDGGALLRKV